MGSLFAPVRPVRPDGSEQQTHTRQTRQTGRQTDKQAEADAREHTEYGQLFNAWHHEVSLVRVAEQVGYAVFVKEIGHAIGFGR